MDPNLALEQLAPAGVLHVDKGAVVVDVRCKCREILLRVVRTPSGLLAVARAFCPPTPRQLRAKESGEWKGGERSEVRLIDTAGGGFSIANPLATYVGWDEAPTWFADLAGEALARCRCGLALICGSDLRRALELHIRTNGGRQFPAPRTLLLDRSAAREHVAGQHARMIAEELQRRGGAPYRPEGAGNG